MLKACMTKCSPRLGNKFNKVPTTHPALNNVTSWGTIQDITVIKFMPG